MSEHAVTTTSVASRPTAVVAQTTTWEEFRGLWPQLLDAVYEFVRPRPELATGSAPGDLWQNVMLYWDDAPSVEVGVLVSRAFGSEGRVTSSSLPAGRIATTIHRGDYAQLGRAHAAVHEFAAARGLELAGPRWEIYGHWDEDPSKVETEVCWLLRA